MNIKSLDTLAEFAHLSVQNLKLYMKILCFYVEQKCCGTFKKIDPYALLKTFKFIAILGE